MCIAVYFDWQQHGNKRTIVYLISQPHCIQAIENLDQKQTCEMQLGIAVLGWHAHIKHNSMRWKEK